MGRPRISPALRRFLDEHGIAESNVWDCHGTPVIKHKALEVVAARMGIQFDMPMIIRSEPDDVCIVVRGSIGDLAEWSFGEASKRNNKNDYPWAMAEKRAKDRVVLKLCKVHGEVYSEDEADDFKDARPRTADGGSRQDKVAPPMPNARRQIASQSQQADRICDEIEEAETEAEVMHVLHVRDDDIRRLYDTAQGRVFNVADNRRRQLAGEVHG